MDFQVIPMLRISDVDIAHGFYVEEIGMTVDWKHQRGDETPVYMQLSRGDMVVQLTEFAHHSQPGSMLVIKTGQLASLHSELSQRMSVCGPLIEPPWGGLSFELQDPFTNRLLFCD